jgi:hypothetical protein
MNIMFAAQTVRKDRKRTVAMVSGVKTDDASFQQGLYHPQTINFPKRANREDRLNIPLAINPGKKKRLLRRQLLIGKTGFGNKNSGHGIG